jgi:phosphoglycerate dehydrogenase-like enzyme
VSRPRLLVSLPDAELRGALGEAADDVEWVDWDMSGPAPLDVIDIVVPPYMGSNRYLGRLEGVTSRLVQSQSLGYDGVADVLPANVVFANAATVHEPSTSELALALILASQRGIPDFVRASERGQWAPAVYPSLADRTVLLVGYGGVNQAIETRLAPFEVTILRVARSARQHERGSVHAMTDLPALLARADVVVVAVPLTKETTHLINDEFLAMMRDASLLVNVARGPVADTAALLEHAQTGRLRLALDVTDPEPLPEGHPLFALPNVLISPHVGGASTARLPRMAALLLDQVDRMRRGEPARNVVLRT